MFKNLKDEINLICPRCKSTNIYIGRDMKIQPDKELKCNDCHYTQSAVKFTKQHHNHKNRDRDN